MINNINKEGIIMHNNRLKSTILYNLRKNKSMCLDDLMEVSTGVKTFQENTGDAIFFEIIIDLFKARFIKFNDKATTDYLKRYRGKTNSFSDGYDFANYLKHRKTKNTLHSIKIEITDYFFRIQDVVGFSVTDLYEKAAKANRHWTHPFFNEPNPKTVCDVFVIMPFDNKLTPIYEDHIRKVCDKIGLDCKRADLVFNTESVINDIWSLIYSAQIVICDCTGKNPNVFYELGIAHSLGKKTICITQNSDDIPFDIKHLRYIQYEYTPRGMNLFEEKLEQHLAIASVENISDKSF